MKTREAVDTGHQQEQENLEKSCWGLIVGERLTEEKLDWIFNQNWYKFIVGLIALYNTEHLITSQWSVLIVIKSNN